MPDRGLFAPDPPCAGFSHVPLPMAPSFSREVSGQIAEDEGDLVAEVSVQTYVGAVPVIAGVQTTLILDRSFIDGMLVEEAHDFFAQDRAGNVW